MDNQVNEDLFPRLQLDILKRFADKWSTKWPVIQKIQLFQYSPFNTQHPKTRNFATKYVILFTIDGDQADAAKVVKATRYNMTILDEYDDGILYPEFMQDGFDDVYKQFPSEGYQKEWLLVPKRRKRRQKGRPRKLTRPWEAPFHFENNRSWLLFTRQKVSDGAVHEKSATEQLSQQTIFIPSMPASEKSVKPTLKKTKKKRPSKRNKVLDDSIKRYLRQNPTYCEGSTSVQSIIDQIRRNFTSHTLCGEQSGSGFFIDANDVFIVEKSKSSIQFELSTLKTYILDIKKKLTQKGK